MPTGRGRPKKEDKYTRVIMFRGTKEHERMLNELCERFGMTRSEVLREALEKFYYLKVLGQMTYFE